MLHTQNIQNIPSPCYVLEETKFRDNLSLIKHVAFSAGVEIILAFKAFSLWKTFPLVKEYISQSTASSPWEARLAWEEMKAPAYTYAPAYTEKDIQEILLFSSHITFNSLTQFHRFYPLLQASGKKISCGLRINPQYSPVGTALYNPAIQGSRLGIVHDQLPDPLPEGVEGLHFHVLCESNSYDLENTFSVVEQRFGNYLPHIKWLNIGGGHLITHKDYDVKHLISLLRTFKARYPHLRLILEPGSAFAWQAGFLLTTVIDIVKNDGIHTAIINASFTCHMPDCLEMPYQPNIRGSIPSYSNVTLPNCYRIGGNSCLAGDFIREPYCFDHPLQPGDTLIFEDMLHYTTVKTTFFNGIRHPAIALLTKEDKLEILRTFSYQDYLYHMN
ncbi:MAG: carboxynorspermidine decarboxylase [Tannerellaceae bacterium]|jgi:carboxynorspermidine decarboxylase|nr:carboxynorspermidine decarboxylase [Tannerellaceae bacterium]